MNNSVDKMGHKSHV